MEKLIGSRKFIIAVLAMTIFVVALYTTEHSPIEVSGALVALCGVYFGANFGNKILGARNGTSDK